MSTIARGCYVTHDKLPELGSGEVVTLDQGVTRIRFAAGERAFSTSMVAQHLTVTERAPAPRAATKAARRSRKD
jgi:hypothetical protein